MIEPKTVAELAEDLAELRMRLTDAEREAATAQTEADRAQAAYDDLEAQMQQAKGVLGELLMKLPGDNAFDRWRNDGTWQRPVNPDGLDANTRAMLDTAQRLQTQIDAARADFHAIKERHQEALRLKNKADRANNERQKRLRALTQGIPYHERQLEQAHQQEAAREAERSSIGGRLAAAFGREQ